MSIGAMSWVWKKSKAQGVDRLVLLAIADCANDDGANAWPALSTLAKKTGLVDRTVRRSLRRLEDLGELVVSPVAGRSHRFRLPMGERSESPPRTQSPPVRKSAPKVSKSAPPDTLSPTPDSPPPKPSRNRQLTVTEPPIPVIFDAWKRACQKNGRTLLTPDRTKLIRQALELYPVEDVVDAVRGWRHSPYHRGENERSTVYNDLEFLLRNAKNIEKFRDLERGQNQPAPRVSKSDGAIKRAMERTNDPRGSNRNSGPPHRGVPELRAVGRDDGSLDRAPLRQAP